MRLGIHTSIAKSLEHAAVQAAGWGANALQIFSSSPRMWRATVPKPDDVAAFRAARERLNLHPLVVHDSYLINLASTDPEIRRKSILAFRGELERAALLGAEYLVAHPGNHKGQDVAAAIAGFVAALAESANGAERGTVMLCLENTAGQGASLGSRFEELAEIRRQAALCTDLPVGYCIDTCHAHAAGYDVATADGLDATLASLDRVLGLDHIRVIHANDSKTPLGSRVDRHEHIGEGHIGRDGFRGILTHPALRSKPFILETPQEQEGDEQKNIDALRELSCLRSSTTTSPSS